MNALQSDREIAKAKRLKNLGAVPNAEIIDEWRRSEWNGAPLKGDTLEDIFCRRWPIPRWTSEDPLSSIDLENANLRDWDLRGRDLKGGHFYGADLRGVRFKGSDISKSHRAFLVIKGTPFGEVIVVPTCDGWQMEIMNLIIPSLLADGVKDYILDQIELEARIYEEGQLLPGDSTCEATVAQPCKCLSVDARSLRGKSEKEIAAEQAREKNRKIIRTQKGYEIERILRIAKGHAAYYADEIDKLAHWKES